MLGLSLITTALQLLWGGSWAAIAFAIVFLKNKAIRAKTPIGWALVGASLFIVPFVVYWQLKWANLEHGESQDAARSTLFFIGLLAVGLPLLVYRLHFARLEEASNRKAQNDQDQRYQQKIEAAKLAKQNYFSSNEIGRCNPSASLAMFAASRC